MWQKLKRWAKSLKDAVWVLALAIKDPRVSWPARLLGAITVAYAISPIDLIPDFIPVLGYLDDLLLLPLGVWGTIKLLPPGLLVEYRQRVATEGTPLLQKSKWAAGVIILLWILLTWWLGRYVWSWYQNR